MPLNLPERCFEETKQACNVLGVRASRTQTMLLILRRSGIKLARPKKVEPTVKLRVVSLIVSNCNYSLNPERLCGDRHSTMFHSITNLKPDLEQVTKRSLQPQSTLGSFFEEHLIQVRHRLNAEIFLSDIDRVRVAESQQ